MPVTATVTATNAASLDARHEPAWLVTGIANLGTLYANPGGMALTVAIIQAAIDTKCASDIPNLTGIYSMQLGVSADGLTAFDYVPASGKIIAYSIGTASTAVAGTTSTLPVLTRVNAEAHVVAADTAALAHTPLIVESVLITVGGVTGACNLRDNAAATTLDCYVNPAGPSVNFLAADAVTGCTVSYIWQSVAGAANTLTVVTPGANPAEVVNGTDLSAAGKNFEFTAIVY